MKVVLKEGHHHILCFDKDEEVMAGLAQYAKEQNIPGGFISALGTCSSVELGFFNSFLKEYRKKPFLDNMEISSFTGNISWVGEEAVIHAHGTFCNNEFETVGGHIFKLVVLATCEVLIMAFDGKMQRENNKDFDLNLLT